MLIHFSVQYKANSFTNTQEQTDSKNLKCTAQPKEFD